MLYVAKKKAPKRKNAGEENAFGMEEGSTNLAGLSTFEPRVLAIMAKNLVLKIKHARSVGGGLRI